MSPQLSLEQMVAMAVDLEPRVAELESAVAELAERPNDSIAVPNTFFITAEGVPAEAGAWQGQWANSDAYNAGAIVKYKGHLYTAILPIPAPEQPALPSPLGVETGFAPMFPGSKDRFGKTVTIEEWLTSGETVEGALSFVSTEDHVADVTPVPNVHTATHYELWRLYAFNMTVAGKLTYKLTPPPSTGNLVFGFAKIGAGNGHGQGLTGEGVTAEELAIGNYILSVQHWPTGGDPQPFQGPWPFALTITAAGLQLIAGNKPPTEDFRWELML